MSLQALLIKILLRFTYTGPRLDHTSDSNFTKIKVARPYNASNNSFSWTKERDVPFATYFVREYAFNAQGEEVAFGQTTNAQKVTNLFEIQAISGLHVCLDIASVCFSSFSLATGQYNHLKSTIGQTSLLCSSDNVTSQAGGVNNPPIIIQSALHDIQTYGIY